MKRIQTIAAYLVVLALAGVSSLRSAEPGRMPGKALVRSVSGDATYTKANGEKGNLRVNMDLEAGTTISTGHDAFVYLNVNGYLSTVRVAADTTFTISEMTRVGSARDGDTDTMLEIKTGEILGRVKKISHNSRYEIKTPHGVAGIRGTDFNIKVVLQQDGTFLVTFTSVEGELIVAAIVAGDKVVKILTTAETWSPGYGDVHKTPFELLNMYMTEIVAMENFLINIGAPPGSLIDVYPNNSPTLPPSSIHK